MLNIVSLNFRNIILPTFIFFSFICVELSKNCTSFHVFITQFFYCAICY